MKILVTGGTGFLGSHLVPLLLQAGHEVRLLGRSPPRNADRPGLTFLRGDLRNREVLKSAVQDIDAIYHLAGKVSFRDIDGRSMYELHVDCTRELLREVVATKQRPRFILASTSGAIAVSKTARLGVETDHYPIEVVGRWPYYLSKIYEEKLVLEQCRKHELPAVVLNPGLLLGPGDERLSSTWTVVKYLNREIPAMPSGGLSYVDARDAADAFFLALTRGELYGRHLLGVNLSFVDFFSRLERLTGVPAPRLKLPSTLNVLGVQLLEKIAKARDREPVLDPQEADIGEHYFYVDASKAARELDFRPREIQDTLYDTVQDIFSRMPPGHLPGIKGQLEALRAGR